MNFRSVKDSGWINCDDVTTLVGINEAGKSNLLLALWKLNPAFGGKIDILHDLPVDHLAELREKTDQTCFIEAIFSVSDNACDIISEEVGCDFSAVKTITVRRFYNEDISIDLDGITPISTKKKSIEEEDEEGNKTTKEIDIDYNQEDLKKSIISHLPKFVYYSNYGNLSTRIYLPNVVKWLKNETVPGIDINENQVRTLRVLFKFVNLKPEEILELGKDYAEERRRSGYEPTVKEIEKADTAKEERSILLQSASTKLTKDFQKWWNQGEYKFRFEADGDYFRIWVSDAKRPAEVSLELRSTGLQWFLSFYLIFLVESQEQHKNAILLLDEAGLTLHPLAQKDLSKFFNSLSLNNQIINTTHSPFIIDTNNIDRCKVVYMDKDGLTVASDDLRQGNDCLNDKSIYAVHAALGLSVSDILMQGCKPVIVEGPSDQIYLNTIKQTLISLKMIAPKEEIVFIPTGGVKGIPGVVSILGAKVGNLPFVLVDSDKSGEDAKNKLIGNNGLYKEQPTSVHGIKEFCGYDSCEVEDLFTYEMLSKGIEKLFRNIDDDDIESFEDIYIPEKAILPQIEEYAKDNNFNLPRGWKVDLARNAKKNILSHAEKTNDKVKKWKALFDLIESEKKNKKK